MSRKNPFIIRLTVTVEGKHDEDIEAGLEEVLRKVKDGYLAGFDSNDTGAFKFESAIDTRTLAW